MVILKKDEKGSFLSNIPPLGPPLMASQESFLEVVEGLAIARQVSDNLLSETMCLNSLCYFKVVLFIFLRYGDLQMFPIKLITISGFKNNFNIVEWQFKREMPPP